MRKITLIIGVACLISSCGIQFGNYERWKKVHGNNTCEIKDTSHLKIKTKASNSNRSSVNILFSSKTIDKLIEIQPNNSAIGSPEIFIEWKVLEKDYLNKTVLKRGVQIATIYIYQDLKNDNVYKVLPPKEPLVFDLILTHYGWKTKTGDYEIAIYKSVGPKSGFHPCVSDGTNISKKIWEDAPKKYKNKNKLHYDKIEGLQVGTFTANIHQPFDWVLDINPKWLYYNYPSKTVNTFEAKNILEKIELLHTN